MVFEQDFWRESFYTLIDNLSVGIHITDNRGITRFYNQAAANIDGIEPQTALGKHILEMFPSLTKDTSTILQVINTGESVIAREQEIRNLYGVSLYLLTTTVPIRVNQEIVGAIDISENITSMKKLAEKVVDLQADLKHRRKHPQTERAGYTFNDVIGEHPLLKDVIKRAQKAARTDSPILIYGETGTGKELLVQSIHNLSPRRSAPFISQNCAALPSTLMESILFGTTKGSFTGAENRSGLVELADGGTLFLDEITCLDIELQAKLLRFIQEGSIRKVGDSLLRPVNVRIMASTNLEPLQAIEEKRLRPDLYYRLNVVNLTLPPLRERQSDIQLLTDYFVSELNAKLNCRISGVTEDVYEVFARYGWPGNIRELRCTIEGAMNLCENGQLELMHLPPYILQKVQKQALDLRAMEDLPLQEALTKVEAALIQSALERAGWNISQAAKILGVPRQTLQYKMQNLHIRTPNKN